MSKKRSQRNTKRFKKSRARAGIPRQDLRSGGRVKAYGGGNQEDYDPNASDNNGDKKDDDLMTTLPVGDDPADEVINPNPVKPDVPKADVAKTDPKIRTKKYQIEDITTKKDAVDTPDTIVPEEGVAQAGEAVVADAGLGKDFTPEQMQENWKASDEYQVAFEKAEQAADQEVADLEAKRKRLLARSKEIEGTGHRGYGRDLKELDKQIKKLSLKDKAENLLKS